MIRAAAKNHHGVAVLVDAREPTTRCSRSCSESGGEISTETRHWLANEAFAHTAAYDAAITPLVRRSATRRSRSTG